MEITSVLWRLLSTVEIKILNVTNFQSLEIFFRAYFSLQSDQTHHRAQVLSTADMFKDLGMKI